MCAAFLLWLVGICAERSPSNHSLDSPGSKAEATAACVVASSTALLAEEVSSLDDRVVSSAAFVDADSAALSTTVNSLAVVTSSGDVTASAVVTSSAVVSASVTSLLAIVESLTLVVESAKRR